MNNPMGGVIPPTHHGEVGTPMDSNSEPRFSVKPAAGGSIPPFPNTTNELIQMVEVKIDLMGAEPYLYIDPAVFVAIRRFFKGNVNERLLFLHGTVDNESRYGIVKSITIPPQTSEYSSVELNVDHEDYFEWHDAYKARCEEYPVIGMAHSFSGGAHHSPRDENTDALFGEESLDRGNQWFFSATAHSGGKGTDFRVDAIFTPNDEAVKSMFFKQIAITNIGWGYDVDEGLIRELLKDTDKLVGAKTYDYNKNRQTKAQKRAAKAAAKVDDKKK